MSTNTEFETFMDGCRETVYAINDIMFIVPSDLRPQIGEFCNAWTRSGEIFCNLEGDDKPDITWKLKAIYTPSNQPQCTYNYSLSLQLSYTYLTVPLCFLLDQRLVKQYGGAGNETAIRQLSVSKPEDFFLIVPPILIPQISSKFFHDTLPYVNKFLEDVENFAENIVQNSGNFGTKYTYIRDHKAYSRKLKERELRYRDLLNQVCSKLRITSLQIEASKAFANNQHLAETKEGLESVMEMISTKIY